MVKSLYDVVGQVNAAYDLVSEHTSVDRNPALKKVYAQHSSNPVIKSLMDGEAGVEYQLLRYAAGHLENKRHMEEILGTLPNVSLDYIAATGMGGVTGVLTNILWSGTDLSRRDMIRLGLVTALGAGLGIGVDSIKKEWNLNHMEQFFKRAQLLDKTYRSIG